MRITNQFQFLWRRKWVIAATIFFALASAAVFTRIVQPSYAATTTLVIHTATTGSINAPYYDLNYTDRLMNTFSEIVTSDLMLDELAERLSLTEKPEVNVELPAKTELMHITVEAPDPVVARDAANTLAQLFITRVGEIYLNSRTATSENISVRLVEIEEAISLAREELRDALETTPQNTDLIETIRQTIAVKEEVYRSLLSQYEQYRTKEEIPFSSISVLEEANIPASPASPRTNLVLGIGLLMGIAGGLGLATFFEHLDNKLYTTPEIEAATATPVIAEIPFIHGPKCIGIVSSPGPEADSFRRLQTTILGMNTDVMPKAILVTSAYAGEGKSTVVANLAVSIAETGHAVVIVDCDMRRPTQHNIFSINETAGLSDILLDRVSTDETIHESHIPLVSVITSGQETANPASLLNSSNMANLTHSLKQRYDVVLLDSPAYLGVPDAPVLAQIVDGVLLVVARGQSSREAIFTVCQQLTRIKAKVLGVVATRMPPNYDKRYYQSPLKRQR